MKNFRLIWLALPVLLLLLLAPSGNPAQAQSGASRTWVSGVGDDANPCSRTAPCKTFAGAISKTAAGGEIDALDPGGFGAVTIIKSITIDGRGTLASILVGGTNAIVVNAGPNDIVTIRNLALTGGGSGVLGLNGIRFLTGGALVVEDVDISNFSGVGVDFEPGATSTLAIDRLHVSNAAGGGILSKPGSSGHAKGAINNAFINNSAFGIRAEDRSTLTVRNSTASSNPNNGYVAVSTSAPVILNISDSLATDSVGTAASAGVRSVGAQATVRLSNVTIFNNSSGIVSSGGGAVLSFHNNQNGGNPSGDGAPTGLLNQQ